MCFSYFELFSMFILLIEFKSKYWLDLLILVGFGISNKDTRKIASINSDGVIIGSAYINMLTKHGIKQTKKFINKLKID